MKLTHRIIHLDTIDSTNRYLREMDCPAEEDLLVCVADYQTAGRGQGTNTWESEKGKNLLFSVLAKPVDIAPTQQFILSEACALALKDVLDARVDDITLKWPNDIYWQDCKLSGTLIETSLFGGRIRHCIFGVGLNVNQREFKSDAPNPVSLWQIVQHETDREHLLEQIICQLKRRLEQAYQGCYDEIQQAYHQALYRKDGYHPYRDENGVFLARIIEVKPDGHLILDDMQGEQRTYAFKEVEFFRGQGTRGYGQEITQQAFFLNS